MPSKFSERKFFKLNSCSISSNYIESAFLYVYPFKKHRNYAHFANKI